MPAEYSVTERIKTYEPMRIINSETKEVKIFYVNVDERGLWTELVNVSDGFINSKIQEGIEAFRSRFFTYDVPKIQEDWFFRGVKQEYARIKLVPWYRRLFNKF